MTPAEFLEAITQPAAGTLPIQIPASRSDMAGGFAAAGYRHGAEIGTWEGGFAEILCQQNPGLALICVDPWSTQPDYKEGKNDATRMRQAYEAARARLAPFNCTLLKMTSAQAAPTIPDGSLDFIYVDGNHLLPHVQADLRLWVPKVRRGGIVAGHDYFIKKPKAFIQVKPAVDQYTKDHGVSPWFELCGDRSHSYCWVVS